MCDWREKAEGISNRIGNRFADEYFPPQFAQNLLPGVVKKGHCLACGRPMEYQEMFPAGKTPRYMCDSCYEQIAFSGPKERCLTCGGFLDENRVREQMRNPRELKYAFHEGLCEDFHAMLAGIVLGVHFRIAQSSPVRLLPAAQEKLSLDQHLSPGQRVMQMTDRRFEKPSRKVKFLGLLR
jgi:hypothetical protein